MGVALLFLHKNSKYISKGLFSKGEHLYNVVLEGRGTYNV